MRISVPNLPIPRKRHGVRDPIDLHQSIEKVAELFRRGHGKTVVMTGAGVSVDSGIPDYRGPNGTYIVNKTYRPIFYHEFLSSHSSRKRYWSRSYLGYPPVLKAAPNSTHYAIAALSKMGYVSSLITQNVDRLHHRAFELVPWATEALAPSNPSVYASPPPSARFVSRHDSEIHVNKRRTLPLELHGTLHTVRCTSPGCTYVASRSSFQDQLTTLNPDWAAFAEMATAQGKEPRTNPDGDVDLKHKTYGDFIYPCCPACLQNKSGKSSHDRSLVREHEESLGAEGVGVMKPSVIFFGENVDSQVKSEAHTSITNAANLLVVGSSLATYSAFRLVKQGVESGIEVGLLNLGPTRADELIHSDYEDGRLWKSELGSGQVLPEVVRLLAGESVRFASSAARSELQNLLSDRQNVPHKEGKVMAA